ncbi:MAG: nitrite reductase large subunit NirB, partial [Bacilli bacterium]
DDFMRTSEPNVYAVGECVEHDGIAYGLVAPLFEQASIVARTICGETEARFVPKPLGTTLKVTGIDLYSAGVINEDASMKTIRIENEFDGIYKKIIIKNEKVVGFVLYGDSSDATRFMRFLTKEESVAGLTSVDLLKPTEENESVVASMSDDELICGCNGITKGAIVEAIVTQGLQSVDDVKRCTSAGRSCGGCLGLVGDLLAHTLGDAYDSTAKKETVCGCTTHSHDEVVEQIRILGLQTVKEVMNVLEWGNEEGCSKCRPALNYYLGMVNATTYEDDRNSRLVNEKMHGNIQRNGTYSVVPRMHGGVTNAADLRKIADVADKYNVPLVKITGAQRIGLFGVEKENLPSVWADLGMGSGYAYGKSLRTAKTCVGAPFCRFGTQPSMEMGIMLEKKFDRLDTPHKFKIGVSACPRNCAEAEIKDLGIVGIDGGWEISVGGNGGTDLRGADLLAKVESMEQVMEWSCAFIQLYREEAHYLDRTSKWIERVGIAYVRTQLQEDDIRKALAERLDIATERYAEPWSKIIADEALQKELYDTEVIED